MNAVRWESARASDVMMKQDMNTRQQESCKHCGGSITIDQTVCPHCGIPLKAGKRRHPQRRFLMFFAALVVFCLLLIYWLPPDWSPFLRK